MLVLDQMGSSKEGYTTYLLSLDVDSSQISNIFAVFGDEQSPISLPPAFQMDDPWGSNVGPVRRTFLASHSFLRSTALAPGEHHE